MPTVLWQSEDSFATKIVIWSGGTNLIGFISKGHRAFGDGQYGYSLLQSMFRVVNGRDQDRHPTEITPEGGYPQGWVMDNILGDYGSTWGSLAVTAQRQVKLPITTMSGLGPTELFSSGYPQYIGSWDTLSGWLNLSAVDVEFPENPDSPRFLIGFTGPGPSKVKVVLITGDTFDTRYDSGWSGLLDDEGIVTDLESVRIV